MRGVSVALSQSQIGGVGVRGRRLIVLAASFEGLLRTFVRLLFAA